ncbi:MAG: hypothetical protein H6815_09130 [Phycisphaeraceae bacterium]|nr:hypothetical protein [Phycisphaerales bacterium]MCB9860602.1 hypothetical protein [Phycisphaeraceae bacterium]
MNAILSWAKSNLVIVILMAVAIVALPVGWFFSSGMNKNLRESRTNQVQGAKSQLDNVSQVEYSDINDGFGGQPVSLSSAPHDQLTQVFAQRRQQQEQEIRKVVEAVQVIGHESRDMLVDGLFPKAPEDVTQRNSLLNQMVKELEWRGANDRTSAYGRLLSMVRAGTPPDGAMLGERLNDLKATETTRIQQSGNQLTPDDEDAIADKLIGVRLGQYKLRADELSTYMQQDAFLYTNDARVPPFAPNTYGRIPKYEECFVWQYDYWILRDVLRAVVKANSNENGEPTSVPDSTVKRITRVLQNRSDYLTLIEKAEADKANGQAGSMMEITFGLESEQLEPDYTESVSGRVLSNGLYETRLVDITVIASFAKLPKLFEAINTTGIMSIVGMQMEAVDIEKDLNQGFYYGDEYVVQVELNIEVVYQRSWFSQYIPDSIKEVIGMPVEKPEENFEDIG